MKQTKNKKSAKKVKKTKFSSEIRHLQVLRDFSIRAIVGNYQSVDDLFIAQALRLEEKIKKLKENQ